MALSCDSRCCAKSLSIRCSTSPPIQDHLSRFASQHHFKPGFELVEMETMRYCRFDVQPGLQHNRHLVPRLVHFTAINSFYREHVENHLVPVKRHALRWLSLIHISEPT